MTAAQYAEMETLKRVVDDARKTLANLSPRALDLIEHKLGREAMLKNDRILRNLEVKLIDLSCYLS